MIRVLHILHRVNFGGAEQLLLNVYRNIDNKNYQFDFLLRSHDNNEDLIEEIKGYGGKVYIAPPFPKKLPENIKFTKKIIKSGNYDYIHVHSNALVYTVPLFIKSQSKIVLHSHNTSAATGLSTVVHYINRILLSFRKIKRVACSDLAGKWLFGNKSFTVINNGVKLDKYYPDEKIRSKIRKDFEFNDEDFVIGHVGRFEKPKNHKYLIDVFEKVYNGNNKTRLLLVGDGGLLQETIDYVRQKKLENYVKFAGSRQDVYDLYKAMDCFALPSLFEGLAIVAIEAQAAGLKAFLSDNVSNETSLLKTNEFLPIAADSKELWAKRILSYSNQEKAEYISNPEALECFDISYTVKQFEETYS